jgi:hypothetical protein
LIAVAFCTQRSVSWLTDSSQLRNNRKTAYQRQWVYLIKAREIRNRELTGPERVSK